MVLFGPPELEQRLRLWLGGEVGDPEIAQRLRTEHEYFVIGELTPDDAAQATAGE